MPIIIKNYEWQQTEKYITIKLPLKNVHQKDVDLTTSKNYLKASYSPYFFELFPLKPIDDTKSNCYIQDEEIIFEICKEETGLWDELEANLSKSEKMELKKKYLEEMQQRAQELDKLKVNKRAELKRQAVRAQISLDTEFRNETERLKKEDTENALRTLKLTEIPNETDSVSLQQSTSKSLEENYELIKITDISKPKPKSKLTKLRNPSITTLAQKIQPPVAVPLPRKCQSVNITFTERVFPTPSRESKAAEENEWLAKQAEARRTSGFVDEDLRPEERNPQWLQDKGDEFFKAENYLAAVSAYTSGIKISKNLVSLYVKRSAAQFELGNFYKCTDDCSKALELMTPICEANKLMRVECLSRRGAALIKIGLIKEGKGEIEAAIKLVPENEKLKRDLQYIEAQGQK